MAARHQELFHRCLLSHHDRDCEGSAESDVLLAAQQLMQLSDEENGCIVGSCKKKKKQKRGGVEPSASRPIPMKEVFGGEDGFYWLKKRRRRFRDIADIHTVTEHEKC